MVIAILDGVQTNVTNGFVDTTDCRTQQEPDQYGMVEISQNVQEVSTASNNGHGYFIRATRVFLLSGIPLSRTITKTSITNCGLVFNGKFVNSYSLKSLIHLIITNISGITIYDLATFCFIFHVCISYLQS